LKQYNASTRNFNPEFFYIANRMKYFTFLFLISFPFSAVHSRSIESKHDLVNYRLRELIIESSRLQSGKIPNTWEEIYYAGIASDYNYAFNGDISENYTFIPYEEGKKFIEGILFIVRTKADIEESWLMPTRKYRRVIYFDLNNELQCKRFLEVEFQDLLKKYKIKIPEPTPYLPSWDKKWKLRMTGYLMQKKLNEMKKL
jgi:hypothetical protein